MCSRTGSATPGTGWSNAPDAVRNLSDRRVGRAPQARNRPVRLSDGCSQPTPCASFMRPPMVSAAFSARLLAIDGVLGAVQIARHADGPVKVVWTREGSYPARYASA